VDNGEVRPRPGLPSPPHAYHLLPRASSKVNAVAAHMRARGYAREECIAVGDSAEDIAVADVVARFFLVANAGEEARAAIGGRPNVEITEERNGAGFYEAVVRTLAEA
jgi:hydroxymethylpyrimidine pyrophosphatase-like HAD family hydrolase